MKLEVGMYVRTKRGIIDKIIDIKFNDNYNTEPSQILLEKHKGYIEHKNHNVKKENNKLVINDDTKTYWFSATEISNASHNIIDLIGVGDYVNGILIESIYKREKDRLLCHCWNEEIMFEINSNSIQTILTKEQFEREAYYKYENK